MKSITIISILLLIGLNGFGQKKYTPNWGLIYFGDTILIDHTEILVGEWLDYVYYNDPSKYPSYLKRGGVDLSDLEKSRLKKQKIDKSLLPDLSVISHIEGTYIFNGCDKCDLIRFSSIACKIQLPVPSDSLLNRQSKLRLQKYLETPITGISYNQAIEFCKWRTITDSLRYFIPVGDTVPFITHGESYIFSLPTSEEFDNINPNQDSIANRKGIIANYNHKNAQYSTKKSKSDENEECGKTLMKRYSFFDSNKWIYETTVDMQGNASEMTSTEGVAKGGSYFHYANQSLKGIENHYTKPETWLGFRCVARRR
ncbi:MAG: SUMF1/EgtB/PvdO family nonheme iron enzyme [Flavobacteriales bacterium]|nr:SUMF1/EgtB/PvdO family nonheme iron enzyme [Flavobacteriales bacterium]